MYKFLDIGELGWAMYLSAHVNWLMFRQAKCHVITNRPAMFNCDTEPIVGFEHWDKEPDGFGRVGLSESDIRKQYRDLAPHLEYKPDWRILQMLVVLPYSVTRIIKDDYIVVLPRRRKGKFAKRNLSEKFYRDLIRRLSEEHKVVSIGSKDGAYDIDTLNPNYDNYVGKTNIQEMINVLSSANCVIGGTSAPPKISLLQGTPTYIIGHEKRRFTVFENWSCTPVGFHEIEANEYSEVELDNHLYKDIQKFILRHEKGTNGVISVNKGENG